MDCRGSWWSSGVWFCFRLVNLPKFADFLIAVEAEMSKVSWPTRAELMRGSVVVIVTLVFLAAMLTVYDSIWQSLLSSWVFVEHGVVWQ